MAPFAGLVAVNLPSDIGRDVFQAGPAGDVLVRDGPLDGPFPRGERPPSVHDRFVGIRPWIGPGARIRGLRLDEIGKVRRHVGMDGRLVGGGPADFRLSVRNGCRVVGIGGHILSGQFLIPQATGRVPAGPVAEMPAVAVETAVADPRGAPVLDGVDGIDDHVEMHLPVHFFRRFHDGVVHLGLVVVVIAELGGGRCLGRAPAGVVDDLEILVAGFLAGVGDKVFQIGVEPGIESVVAGAFLETDVVPFLVRESPLHGVICRLREITVHDFPVTVIGEIPGGLGPVGLEVAAADVQVADDDLLAGGGEQRSQFLLDGIGGKTVADGENPEDAVVCGHLARIRRFLRFRFRLRLGFGLRLGFRFRIRLFRRRNDRRLGSSATGSDGQEGERCKEPKDLFHGVETAFWGTTPSAHRPVRGWRRIPEGRRRSGCS